MTPSPTTFGWWRANLVSNVVQHTDDGGTVRAWDPKPDVPFRLEVEDADRGSPDSEETNNDGGKGLHIVDELSDEWGVDRSPRGKTVWAEFDRTKTSADE